MYAGLWSAGFVWDDIPLIVQNQAIADGAVGPLFTSDLWADSGAGEVSSGYYRPLVLLSFALDRWLFDLNPMGYHFHSLGWHLLAVVGLYRLCREFIGVDAAFVAATVFAVHPVQSEVVSWIAARNDLMAAALGFLALSLVWKEGQTSAAQWLGSMLLTLMACLSKETALLLPVLLITADVARNRRVGLWTRVSAPLLGVILVVGLRVWLGIGGSTLPSAGGWLLFVQSGLHWLGIMGSAFLSPWPISSARDLSWISLTPTPQIFAGIFFWLFLCFIAWIAAGERRRIVIMGMVWVCVLLGLTVVPTADKGGFGDRFLYWPMSGLAVIVGVTCASWWRTFVPALLIPAAIVLYVRMPDWQNDRALWGAAVRDVPTPTNELSLGHALTLHSRHKRAHVNFVSALAGEGMDVEACAPIVGSAMRAGLSQHAFRMGVWAQGRGCTESGVFNGWMATAAAMTGDWGLAQKWSEAEPADPKGRSRVVQAAIARRKGDLERYAEIEKTWLGERPLDVQVGALIGRDGLDPLER